MPFALFTVLAAVGAVAGAGVRWAVLDLAGSGLAEGAATVVVNGAGSWLAGALLGAGARRDRPGWPLLGPGFCGGLTTFAAVPADVARRLGDGQPLGAVLVVVVVVAVTVPAAGLGWRWGAGRRAAR